MASFTPWKEWTILGGGFAFCFAAGLGVGFIVQAAPADSTPLSASAPTSTMPPATTTPGNAATSPPERAMTPLPKPSPTPSPTPTPKPTPYDGDVLAYGDSILILAESCLLDRGFDVDSEESRPVRSGPAELLAYGDALPDRVLIHLGTNGGAYAEDYDAIMDVLGNERIVTFATIQLPNDYDRYTFEDRTNDEIRALPDRYPNVRVFDWHRASDDKADWLYADGFHPNLEGCKAYARLAERTVRAP